ncbi:hypothetical protein AAHA92_03350 [Salvia divinorum]|uniref:Oxidoreductase-like domain-containing protein n=1 Tax=Salvia divinorum TaxID=28513 RepID=A0ABD1IGT5_SALDI
MAILYTQTHHYSSASSPPPTANLPRSLHRQNVLRRHDHTMPLIDLTLRRITTNRNNFRFNQATQSFSIAEQYTSTNHPMMAEETKDASQWKADTPALSVSKSTEEKEKGLEKSTPAVPPPEKPLPGDCCGSGCVRCVWDVYYEELEEYNKLQKVDS